VSRGLVLLVSTVMAAGGCATPGQVRRVETQVAVLRNQQARADSARAAELARIIALQGRILDSLEASRESLRQFRGEVSQDLLSVQQQLVQVQELTGQSQRRLAELKRDIDNRSEELAGQDSTRRPAATDTTVAPPPPGTPSPDQLYQGALAEARRGSYSTARSAFQEFVRLYPTHAQMPDALYQLGETFRDVPDSAVSYYQRVVEQYPKSSRAPSALYKLGLVAEQRPDRAGARRYYQQVVQQYPRSSEASLARQKLASLQP
jgi:tol-pal system protein YbgF